MALRNLREIHRIQITALERSVKRPLSKRDIKPLFGLCVMGTEQFKLRGSGKSGKSKSRLNKVAARVHSDLRFGLFYLRTLNPSF